MMPEKYFENIVKYAEILTSRKLLIKRKPQYLKNRFIQFNNLTHYNVKKIKRFPVELVSRL